MDGRGEQEGRGWVLQRSREAEAGLPEGQALSWLFKKINV